MYGARFTNETAVDACLSQQVAGVARPGRSCSWITWSPLRGTVGTRLRISGSFAEPTTDFMPDNALEPYISHQKSPLSERALLAPETQRDRRMRPIRTRIAGEEADRAARNCPDKGRCPFAPDNAQFRTRFAPRGHAFRRAFASATSEGSAEPFRFGRTTRKGGWPLTLREHAPSSPVSPHRRQRCDQS